MPISIECPSCNKSINAPDKYAGKVAKCPGCQGKVRFPSAEPRATGNNSPPPPPTFDDGFDDIVSDQAESPLMPLEPAVEMQSVAYGSNESTSSDTRENKEFSLGNVVGVLASIVFFGCAAVVLMNTFSLETPESVMHQIYYIGRWLLCVFLVNTGCVAFLFFKSVGGR